MESKDSIDCLCNATFGNEDSIFSRRSSSQDSTHKSPEFLSGKIKQEEIMKPKEKLIQSEQKMIKSNHDPILDARFTFGRNVKTHKRSKTELKVPSVFKRLAEDLYRTHVIKNVVLIKQQVISGTEREDTTKVDCGFRAQSAYS